MKTAAAPPRHNFADLSILPPGGSTAIQRAARRPGPADRSGLPERLKSGIEALSGVSMDGVRVRYNSPYPAQLGALAYARGREIHLAAGQEAHLPHEAWHLVQQARGRVRPTGQAPGGVSLNDDPMLEREADTMGARAASGAAAPAAVTDPAPMPAAIAAPIQRQTPWWKKALMGVGMIGGAAAAATGIALASPALALGGAAAALGAGGYAAYRAYQDSKVKLSIPADHGTMKSMRAAMGNDPNVSFGRGRIDSRYDAQQMMDQYRNTEKAPWRESVENLIDQLGAGGQTVRTIPAEAKRARRMDAAFAPPGVFERNEKATHDRRARASHQINNFDYDAHDLRRAPHVIDGDRDAVSNAPDAATAMTDILARHEGVTLGEDHGDPATKQFLAGHLATMKASKVKTLYMEHFRADHQAHLDQYLASGQMPPELDRYVRNQDLQHNAGQHRLREILTQAQVLEMRVRGIDSRTAAMPDDPGEGVAAIRDAAMNNVAHEVITGDAAARAGGKYAILTGRAHNNTQPATRYGFQHGFEHGATGLSQLLEIPALTIHQGRPVLDEEQRANRARLPADLR